MKEDNKYYTPEIEEFHVGFEYENFVKRKGWTKRIVECLEDVYLNEENALLDYDDYRVKHLDKEDIESLEFVCEIVECGEDTETDVFGIRRIHENAYLGNFHVNQKQNIDLFNNYYIIKNKSELKKLLKQLSI